ncbi:uncharacterized protein [Rutidosis leptorrhynchoides]|uniref:uncharacterized protein n=1 Tax=Rutidosis leptorrhynchoides TaxID=125765 RepID=UPI003A9929B5
MKVLEAVYVYSLLMFAKHQVQFRDVGLEILIQAFPPLPDLVIAVKNRVFAMLARLWLFNRQPFENVRRRCPNLAHQGYFSDAHGWDQQLQPPECMSYYVDYGDLTYICSACGAKLWLKETKRGKLTQGLTAAESLCCQKGKIGLPEFTKSPPKLIWDLYTNNQPKSKHFLENIRRYNMIFAFTSMGGKVDNRFNNNRGPYTFRMSGQNFHRYGGLLPNVGHKPRFGQLYIYDTSNEANNRKEAISGKNKTKSTSSRYSLDENLIVQIMQVLDEHNPLVKTFRMASERFKDDPDMQLKIKLIGRRTKDGRNYNLPTVDEVAALIVGDINVSSFDERDILIESHVEGLKRISELHPEYLALQYPLLFIYAEDGYHTDILHRDVDVYEHTTRKKKRVTMREFFAYKLQERAVPTLVHLGRKLYQQFVVDAYTMIEAERISYIRKNQNILRADTFTNIMNASLSGNAVNSMMGNMIKLPSSFTGSARYMIENYRDAIALCCVFGYPDLFLTFTCNPKWPEITRELDGTGFKPEDKPGLCARMFKMKLDQLMKDIRKKKIFGTLKACLPINF